MADTLKLPGQDYLPCQLRDAAVLEYLIGELSQNLSCLLDSSDCQLARDAVINRFRHASSQLDLDLQCYLLQMIDKIEDDPAYREDRP